jgi:uncharacterized protein with beta-barrel porin domain
MTRASRVCDCGSGTTACAITLSTAVVVPGIGESRYGLDAGASTSLSLTNTARLYVNYDGKLRNELRLHQGTVGFEYRW